jgi:hypothetical protein
MTLMVEDRPQVLAQLRRMPLFSPLTGAQLNALVDRFDSITLEEGEGLFTDREPEQNYYVLVSGQITVHPGLGGGELPPKVLLPGESFDEETLLYGYPPTVQILASQHSKLLRLDSEAFDRLPAEFPAIKPSLGRTAETRQLVSRHEFDWLRPDEVIYYLARKHEIIFVYTLIGPLLVFLIAIVLAFWVSFNNVSSTIWTGGAIIAGFLALGAILWGIWNWIDWGNDFYIVTDQRVVWVEKVIWLYESRDEAPHNTILSVDVNTTFLGRLIQYGSIYVRTFTGQIIFRNAKDPYEMARFIDEYRFRARRHSERIERSKLDRAIRQRIEPDNGISLPPEIVPPITPPPPPRLSFWQRYFSNFFTMRFEQGEVITYRKYWPTLLRYVAIPSLFILLLWMGIAFLVNMYRLGEIPLSWLEVLLLLCLALFIVLAIWWLYQYVDWRNDIYQVTDKFIFDIYRKPLGTEEKKSAPLENILTLEHERQGFLGYLLNFGNVIITVGGAKFTFNYVHDPARVQQDIFDRMYALRRKNEQDEANRQRDRMVDAIASYHRNQAETKLEEELDDYEIDDYLT